MPISAEIISCNAGLFLVYMEKFIAYILQMFWFFFLEHPKLFWIDTCHTPTYFFFFFYFLLICEIRLPTLFLNSFSDRVWDSPSSQGRRSISHSANGLWRIEPIWFSFALNEILCDPFARPLPKSPCCFICCTIAFHCSCDCANSISGELFRLHSMVYFLSPGWCIYGCGFIPHFVVY